ncbi:CBS domain-containing protein [Streptomyces sp. NPDC001606]
MAYSTVGEVMTDEVVTALGGTPATRVVRLLERHGISGVPVVDRDDKVLGVVSGSDLARDWAVRGEASGRRALAARDLMSSPAVTVHPEQAVPDAARLMERRGVERLPVVDEEDRLIGIVTRRDLLRVFLRSDDDILRQVTEGILVSELGLPPDAVTVSVRDGVVTLRGGKGDAELRGALARAVWRLEGVVGVVNPV